MARISQSVEIKAPVHVAYNQLTQFEDYPRFMEEVESARQTDDTHVHWTTRAGSGSHDWDSEIIEQQPDRCIAWRNMGGPVTTGRMDVEQAGPDASRVTFTIEAAVDGAAQAAEGALAQQIGSDLQRLKQMIESSGDASGAWRGEVHAGEVTTRDRDARGGGQGGGQGGGTVQGNSAGTGEATEYGTARMEGAQQKPGASAEGYGDSRLTNTQDGKQ
jgi:hypothetical protein